MAKTTKHEQVELGKRLGSTHAQVSSLSIDVIKAMEWKERQDLSARLALGADIPDSQYHDAAVSAFIDAFQNALSSKVKRYDIALKNYDRARTGISSEQAQERIIELLKGMHLRGRVNIAGDRFDVTRGSCSATVYMKMERVGGWSADDECVRHPDDPMKRAGKYEMRTEVSLGGRTYSATGCSHGRAARRRHGCCKRGRRHDGGRSEHRVDVAGRRTEGELSHGHHQRARME